jgi:hypothetical protein
VENQQGEKLTASARYEQHLHTIDQKNKGYRSRIAARQQELKESFFDEKVRVALAGAGQGLLGAAGGGGWVQRGLLGAAAVCRPVLRAAAAPGPQKVRRPPASGAAGRPARRQCGRVVCRRPGDCPPRPAPWPCACRPGRPAGRRSSRTRRSWRWTAR